jgi:hypothetical protein
LSAFYSKAAETGMQSACHSRNESCKSLPRCQEIDRRREIEAD